MRTLSYYLEMADTYEGYRIDAPLGGPPILMKNTHGENGGTVAADIAQIVKLHEYDDEEYAEMNEQPEDVSEDFALNYARILHGEIPEWELLNVTIRPCYVLLAFKHRETNQTEYLHLSPPWPMLLSLSFAVSSENGDVDKYDLEIICASVDFDDTVCSMTLTEYEGDRKRELEFIGSRDENMYNMILVTEFR